MANFAKQLTRFAKADYRETPSAGAAGGIGFAVLTAFNTTVKSGIDFLGTFQKLEEKVQSAKLVITGEGKIDAQSFYGKTISNVINLCRKHQTPYLLLCGVSELTELQDELCMSIYQLVDYASSPEESLLNPLKAVENLLQDVHFNKLIN